MGMPASLGHRFGGEPCAADVERHLIQLGTLLIRDVRETRRLVFFGRALPHVGVERVLDHTDDFQCRRVVHRAEAKAAAERVLARKEGVGK
jgi:hypothetical protein